MGEFCSKFIEKKTKIFQRRHGKFGPVRVFQVVCSKVQVSYLGKIGKLKGDDTVEIVVVKTKILKLCQLRYLHRYAALEEVGTEVQVSELGEAANG
jgi:hypothetical protein